VQSLRTGSGTGERRVHRGGAGGRARRRPAAGGASRARRLRQLLFQLLQFRLQLLGLARHAAEPAQPTSQWLVKLSPWKVEQMVGGMAHAVSAVVRIGTDPDRDQGLSSQATPCQEAQWQGDTPQKDASTRSKYSCWL